MDWGKWKWAIAGWAGVAFALWGLLYAFYWHDRTGHQVYWGDALITWIGDVVTLQWVDSYQTLIGGVLAVVAAATIILNSALERTRRLADDAKAKRASFYETTSALQMSIKRLAALRVDKATEARVDRAMQQVETQCAAITHEAPPLANAVMYAVTRIEADELGTEEKYALGWAAVFCLRDPARYFETGRFRIRPYVLPESAKKQVEDLSAEDKDRLKLWLDWGE